MTNSDLLPSLLFKINENQLALEAAILELSNWVEKRGAADVADNVRGALDTIDKNDEFIKLRDRYRSNIPPSQCHICRMSCRR